jgi:TATA-binding protein-associated factor Taf7
MKKVILLILCLFPATLFAQSATDYFHKSANFYVNANKKSAQTTIREGIQKFPDNQKLKDLAAKIEELPDPEDEQNQNQDQQNQDNQDQQDQQQQDQKKEEQQQQQISQEDAQRILDAIAQEEKELQEKLQKKERTGSRRIEKNW